MTAGVPLAQALPLLGGGAGAQGPQGAAGAQGPQGPQGPQGSTGPQGIVGAQGSTGPQGVVGAQGPQGAAGAQGPQGAQGAQGTANTAESVLTISSGVVNIDCSLADFYTLAMSNNVTSITFTNLPAAGHAQTIMIQITQNASAAKTLVFPASFKWPGGTTGVISSTLSAIDLVAASTFDQGTTWQVNMSNAYA